MKHFYHIIILILFSAGYCAAQAPSNPSPCTIKGPPTLSITGSSSFTFDSMAKFTATQTSNTITVTVVSTNGSVNYELYVAGIITAQAASSTNTIIPINAFTVSASKNGSAPTTVTLSNSYQTIAINGKTGASGDAQVITLKLNPTLGTGALNQFLQAPGTHTLTLYFCACNN